VVKGNADRAGALHNRQAVVDREIQHRPLADEMQYVGRCLVVCCTVVQLRCMQYGRRNITPRCLGEGGGFVQVHHFFAGRDSFWIQRDLQQRNSPAHVNR
jgi:hypothetical protein